MMDRTVSKCAAEALPEKTRQLQVITDAMTAYLQSGQWDEASAILLTGALALTQSVCGFAAVVVGGQGLRVLAYRDPECGPGPDRPTREQAPAGPKDTAPLEVPNPGDLLGQIIARQQSAMANDAAQDARLSRIPPGRPPWRCFLGVPMVWGGAVVGLIGVADRPGGYSATEQEELEVLGRNAGILFDSYRRFQREIALDRERQQEESALKNLVAGTAAVTGEAFFPAFTQHLAEALDARHVLVAEAVNDSLTQLRVLSLWSDHKWPTNFEFDVTGTPCELVAQGQREAVCIPDRLQERFPRAALLASLRVVSYLGVPLLNAAGQPIGQLSVLDDKPMGDEQRARSILSIFAARAAAELERKRAEMMLRQYTERLQLLSRRLLEVQETERRHTALELHDEIGQALTALKFNLELCARQPTAAMRTGLQEAQTAISSLIEQLREMSLDLRPPMLDHLGLLHALAWHCERFAARFQVQVRFHHSELEGKRFEPTIETAAYRIVQEALTNVARHAGVPEVALEIRAEPETLFLTIADQGRGFNAAEVLTSGTSSGLTGMRERATLLGGTLRVESRPGAGTLVRAALPLKQTVPSR